MCIENSTKASAILINKEGATLVFKENGRELSVMRIKEVQTGKETLIFTIKGGTSLSAPIEFTLSKLNKINRLADYGIPLPKNKWKLLEKMYIDYYESIPLLYCYSEIGWQTNSNGSKFFHGSELVCFSNTVEYNSTDTSNCISLTDAPNIIENTSVRGFNKLDESKYVLSDSKHHLKGLGSYEESIKFFNEVIKEKIIAQVIIATAFSSMIIGILEHNTIILNICGKSSIGKSRLSELATSIYSKPDESRITATFDSTPKSLEAFLNNNNGIAVIIDDTSTGYNGEYEWTSLIYNITKGKSRKRLGRDFKPNPTLNWYTSVITSSEKSMLNSCEKDKFGVLRRCIEIEAGQGEITEDAQAAEYIREFSRNNYGLLGTAFAKQISEKGYNHDTILKMVQEEVHYLQSISEDNGIAQGYAETIAHITVTAELVRNLIGINFDIDYMREYLLELGKYMVEKFEESSFKSKCTFEQAYEMLCKIDEKKCHNYNSKDAYINIPVTTFNDLEKEYGFDRGVLRKLLKDKGLMRTGKGTNDKNVGGKKCVSFLKKM